MAIFKVYQKQVNKTGTAPIYISFYINREKLEIPTKVSIPPKFFNPGKGVVNSNYEFANDKNLIIQQVRSNINDILVEFRLKKISLTKAEFLKAYKNPGQIKDFFSFCKEYQKLRFQEISEGTQDKHKAVLTNLKKFKSEISFNEMNEDLLRKFIIYLRKKRGQKDITINKHISVIKSYLHAAIKKGIITENPACGLKLCKCEDTTAPCISEDQLNILVSLYKEHFFMNDVTNEALEIFLFMCFSSLHIGDALALRIDQIEKNEFNYVRMKLANSRPRVIRIPISEPLRKIISKRIYGRKEGLLFEGVISQQEINKQLKYIASVAKIKERLSAKYGRHTFATIFLRKTRDLNTLKELMGHSNIKQTLVYAHVLDQDKKDGIAAFNIFSL